MEWKRGGRFRNSQLSVFVHFLQRSLVVILCYFVFVPCSLLSLLVRSQINVRNSIRPLNMLYLDVLTHRVYQ